VFNFGDSQPSWIPWVSVAGVLAALLIAIGTAMWQARLQNQLLKNQMFEKRFAVYFALRQFLGEISRTATVDVQRCFKLLYDVDQAEFLFDQSVDRFLMEVYEKALLVHAYESQPERRQEKAELLEWLVSNAYGKAKETFNPYLMLSKANFPKRVASWVNSNLLRHKAKAG
jgi:hypothetical protein